MSKEIISTGSSYGINQNTNIVSSFQNIKDNLLKQTSSSYSNLEVSPQTAQIFEQINDLQIEPSLSSFTGETFTRAGKHSINEILFDACANVKILTSAVSMHLNPKLRKNLFDQVDLIHDSEDWDEDDAPVKKLSFQSFLRWLLLASPERGPGLGLTSSGNLIAAWIDNQDRLILEFSPNDIVKWIVTTHIDDEIERGTGRTKILRLPTVLAPYEVDKFFNKKD